MAGKANKAKSRGKSFHRSATESLEPLSSKEVSVSLDSVESDVPQANGTADNKTENDKEATANVPEATPAKAEGLDLCS